MAWAEDYITTAELKAYARISHADDDVFVADAIAGSCAAINKHCGRQFGRVDTAEERFYTAQWDRHECRWIIPIDDLMTAVGLVVTVDGGDTITDYQLGPRNNVAKGKPWEYITVGSSSSVCPVDTADGMAITASWGWTAVPAAVKTAAKLQGNRVLWRRDSPQGVAGSPDLGSELRLLAKVDADLKPMLADFVRHWTVAPSGNRERTYPWL